MPIYEYACQKCGNEIDVLQKMDDPAPTKCEKCGAKGKMVRRVSRTSFVLKGGGWGADLYGSKKSGSTTSSTGGDATTTTAAAPATPATATSGSTTSSTPAPASSASSTSSTPAPKAKSEKAKK